MILGYKEYFDELLLEAKSPEEVVRILSYKHQDIPESLIKELVDTDPTKKKSYAAWVLNVENDPRKIDSYIKSGKLAKIFKYFRENTNEGASLIDKNSIEEALKYLPDYSDVLEKNGDDKSDDFDIKFESPEWVVAVPNSYEASKKLGQNTKWCTADAYGNGDRYYQDYTRSGPLWVNFDKRKSETLNGVTYPFKRYQFCFERKAFLDARDDPFNWDDMDMPEDVQTFYKDQGYNMEDLMMSDEERFEIYTDRRYQDGVWVFEEVYLLREWDDDMRWDDTEGADYDYMLYDLNNDDTDPIYDSAAYEKNSIVYRNENLDYGVLRQKFSSYGRASAEYTIAIKQTATNRHGADINLFPNLDNYTLLGNNGSEFVAFIDEDDYLTYLTDVGTFKTEERVYSHEAKIFINKNVKLSEKDMYIEVADDGAHSLYKVDPVDIELIEIIPNDIPINGKYFELNKAGKIEGKYETYSPTGEYGDDENANARYTPVKKLANGGFLLVRNQYGLYNIFQTDNMGERLFENDFEGLVFDLSDSNYNAVIINNLGNNGFDEKTLISLSTTRPMSKSYPYMQANSAKTIVIAAEGNVDSRGEMTPGENRFIITGHGDVPVKSAYPYSYNGRTPVYITDNQGHTVFRVLELDTLEFDADWITRISTLCYTSVGSDEGRYILAEDRNGTIHLYDWANNRILSTKIARIKPTYLRDSRENSVSGSLCVITYEDGTVNLFNMKTGELVLNERPTSIRASKAFIPRNSNGIYAMLSFNNGEKNYFIYMTPEGQYKKLLNGEPVLSNGHELYPALQGGIVTFTIDLDRDKTFKLNLDNGEISVFGIHPETRTYDEMPVQMAPDDVKQIATQIFPWMTSKIASLNERMDRLRKKH